MKTHAKETPAAGPWPDWFSANPLRRWLTGKDIPATKFAAMIGVSIPTVQAWLNGRFPGAPYRIAVARAMGVTAHRLEMDWGTWRARKPSL